MATVHLDGMTTTQALAVIARRLAALCDLEVAMLEAGLIRDGVSRAQIDGMLADRREEFAEWHREQLSEFRRWLADCSRLH
jgi:hypothetical protein